MYCYHHRTKHALHPVLIEPSCGFLASEAEVPTALADFVLEILVDCLEVTATTDIVAFDDEAFELFVPLVLSVECFELPDFLSWLFVGME